jgi:hypothetical protein
MSVCIRCDFVWLHIAVWNLLICSAYGSVSPGEKRRVRALERTFLDCRLPYFLPVLSEAHLPPYFRIRGFLGEWRWIATL